MATGEVRDRPPLGRHKVGIALIVSNDYRGTSRPPLPGTEKDASTMSAAFSFLGYEIVLRRNITRDNFLTECKTLAGYDYSLSNGCKRIAVIFSGHGFEQKLILQDDKAVTMDELLNAFKPLSSGNNTLANTVRMFFIDACRISESDSSGNPSGNRGEDPGINVALLSRSPRGGRFNVLKVSSEAEIIIAYSTTEKHKAFEDGSGGLWIQYLAQELCTSDKSLQTVLTDTNNKLTKHFENIDHSIQTAQFISQLTKDIYLLRERPSIPQLAVQFPSVNVTGAAPTVTNTDVREDIPLAHIGSMDPNPPVLVPPPASSSDNMLDTSTGSQSHLREVLTAQGITCQYQITETPSGMDGRLWYSCELSCHSNGMSYKFRSRQYRDRDEAKQDVNKQALAEPNIGHNEIFSRSVVVSYQEKLLAYCSNKGYRSPSYSTQPHSSNGYVSSVLVPRNGKFEGKVAANVDQAKESAAKQALLELGEIHPATEII